MKSIYPLFHCLEKEGNFHCWEKSVTIVSTPFSNWEKACHLEDEVFQIQTWNPEGKIEPMRYYYGFKMLNQEVTDFLKEFDAGTHAVLFYDSQESKRELLFSHLKFGQNYQGLAYVCSEESPEQIRGEMIQFGLEANTVKGNQRLTIANYDDVYIVNGELNIPAIIGKFASLVDTCKEHGLSGLRAGAEMSCFFQHDRVEEMIDL